MNYFLIGLLASLGWYIGKFIVIDIFGEVAHRRLYKTDWYMKLLGSPQNTSNRKTKTMKIGFYTEQND